MVSRTPPTRPSQLLTLKALDPLHQEPERGEDDDCQAYVDEVEHGALLAAGARAHPHGTRFSEPPGSGLKPLPYGTHAEHRRFLTDLMRLTQPPRSPAVG